jgi:hypothetical protein
MVPVNAITTRGRRERKTSALMALTTTPRRELGP